MIKNYRVTTEGDCEGRTTKVLGYAQGEEHIIKNIMTHKKFTEYILRKLI